MLKLAFKLLLSILIIHQCLAEWKPCKKRNAEHCDSPEAIGDLNDSHKLVYYVSDPAEKRLARFELAPNDAASAKGIVEVRVDASQKRQTIFGFGGAFTDAVGINLNALNEQTRDALLGAYYDSEYGIGYTIGRVPIASCDFSTHAYSYLDTPNDFDLTTFALAKEDFELKIPYLHAAKKLVGEGLRLFASPWSAPAWMKNTGRMIGWGFLKGSVDDKYYRCYAHYLQRFFEEYSRHGVTFWGMTTENEPGAGGLSFWRWQAMYLSATTQREFAVKLLSPALKKSILFESAQKIYGTPEGVEAIDGIAVHWYAPSNYDKLEKTHNLRPDKFILASEACTGHRRSEHKPLLGDWSRGKEYAHDILNDLRNWVVGWTDWNLCLDLEGGPNLVRNFVDAPIIVNASAGEFYKQPMFYALAHFSRFVPRDSVVISSTLFTADGTKLPDKTLEEENGLRVLVLINPDQSLRNISVFDEVEGRRWTVPLAGDSIVTAVWKPKNAFDQDSFVCVCSAEHCDSPEAIGDLNDSHKLVYYVSDPADKRLARFELAPTANNAGTAKGIVEVRVDAAQKRQRIFGFGGAFTDAAGISLNALNEQTRDALLGAYYDPKIGIGYTIGPRANRQLRLLHPRLFVLGHAQRLRPHHFCIPYLHAVTKLVGEGLRLFATPWSAPGWMKNTSKMIGWGHLKGSGNMPSWAFQAMYLSATTQREFAVKLLSPILKQSPASKNLKIMAHDDQRHDVFEAAQKFYETPEGVEVIDGIAVHWYIPSTFDQLAKTHNLRPDKFILSTEACNGVSDNKPSLGDWTRGRAYAHDILNDLRNWVVGWTDWNLCLDLQGGPNLVRNFVDSPIIVNASAGEFYKQPMFYALAHFSRFVPRDSVVISSTLFSADLADKTLEKENVEHIAFQTPNGLRVLVLINPDQSLRNISVFDEVEGRRWTVPLAGDSIVTAVWKPKKALKE
uniref:Glucosylceramidase n=1 Tax=Globodera rostochiensis TaxID=31243 RepID=A0A914GV79_GLORO